MHSRTGLQHSTLETQEAEEEEEEDSLTSCVTTN
jgi:hypothetical protein